MVTKVYEFYGIVKWGCCGDDECFDTFEEAKSHINDPHPEYPNRFKYEGYWTGKWGQECDIRRYRLDPTLKKLECMEIWQFRNGEQVRHDTFN